MKIQLLNIKYLLDILDIFGNSADDERIIDFHGYKIDFLINDTIESQVVINTDIEMSIEEIKSNILKRLEKK